MLREVGSSLRRAAPFMLHIIFNHLRKLRIVIEVCTIIYNVCLTGYQLTLYPEILGRVAILLALHIIGME